MKFKKIKLNFMKFGQKFTSGLQGARDLKSLNFSGCITLWKYQNGRVTDLTGRNHPEFLGAFGILKIISVKIFWLAAGLGLIGGFAPAAAWAGLEEGVRAYEAGDYATAIREWQVAADKGDRNALFNLGQIYRMGKGVPRNFDMAEHYYLEAAKLGHSAAQGNLGTLYYFGKADGKPQLEAAVKWWRAAAENGDPRSQYMMGVLYFNGKFVERDMITAYAWMTLAAQSRLKEAVESEVKMAGFLTPKERSAGISLAQSLSKKAGPANVAAENTPPPPAALKEAVKEEAKASQKIAIKPAPKRKVAAVAPPPPPPPPAPAPPSPPPPAALPDETPPASVAEAPPPVQEAPPVAAAAAAPHADPVAATGDGAAFRVQLGAFKSREAAEATWASLKNAHAALLGGLSQVIAEADLGAKGIFYRLQAGAFAASGEATGLCRKLKAAKVACMVVKAPAA
jgi:cell division septation protein DedD